ncbi:MAG: RodZ domain-containing protein, partial [Sphingomonas sp.]
ANVELAPEVLPTVGERLRAAREQKGISLEDVAAQTRIPQRHLASIETAEWDNLPAPTYTIGVGKSYATIVGLDRAEIGDQLREEMGGQRFAATSADVFEPADPRRAMPRSLVIGAFVAVVLLIILMTFISRRSLDQPDETAANSTANAAAGRAAAPAQAPPAAPPAATAQGPVVLTAIAPVWVQVSERGGASLFTGMLQPGQTYAVPANAAAPVLKTGKPEALRIAVGTTVIGQVGPSATTIANVSLQPADLLKTPTPAAPAAIAPAPAPPPAPEPRARRARRAHAPAAVEPAPPAAATPPTTNSAQ